jgi:ribosomal protein S18 acetylase RimI-like enzyme
MRRDKTLRMNVRSFAPEDYLAARQLWESVEGMGLNESDTEPAVHMFLARNPGFSAVAWEGDVLVGAVLCGHDGRRGCLHHLAVAPGRRGQGIARGMLDHCLARLAAAGIPKCNILVLEDNHDGTAFWLHGGWYARPWKSFQIGLGDDTAG